MRFEVDVAESSGAPLVVEADTRQAAARQVMREGGTPLAVRPAREGWRARLARPVGASSGIDQALLALFAQQLAELVAAGVTVEQALALLSPPGGSGAIAALCGRLLSRVRQGSALSRALAEEPGMPGTLTGIVAAAEISGTLDEGLAAAAQSLSREADMVRRIRGLLAYPALLAAVALASTLFMLIGVIPEFAPLFAGEESRLPWVTRVVLFLSDLLTGHVWVLAGVAATLGGTAVLLSRHRRLRAALSGKLLAWPPVQLALRLDAANALAVAGGLLHHGAGALVALTHAAHACRSALLRDALQNGTTRLREGCSIARVFATMPVLPDTTRMLIGVGESTGQMGAAIMRAARLLDVDTQRRIDRWLAVATPAAVIVLGVVIAFLIAGLMLGILSISQLALK